MYAAVTLTRIMVWTSGVVGALAVAVCGFMLQPLSQTLIAPQNATPQTESAPLLIGSAPDSAPNPAKDALASASYDGGGARKPAAAEPQFEAVALADSAHQAIDLKLPCSEKSVFANSVSQVRLSGAACNSETDDAIVSSEITNLTNGFTASTFPTGVPNAFTTDYISLVNGVNRLHIVHVFKSGKREDREYIIERAISSVAN